MPFGLTYAEFVIGVGLAMFYGPADTSPTARQNSLTFGTLTHRENLIGTENFATFTQRHDTLIWDKFNPIYAIGVSDKGTAFASAGLGRALDVFGVKIFPFTGPALYISNDNKDLLQFRTGFDITQTLGSNLTLTGGYYHISNAQANDPSADIDVAHLGIAWRF